MKVLVIDDSESDRDLTVRFVHRRLPKATVETCSDAQEGLDSLLRYSKGPAEDLPALVIMDQKMPRLNGDEIMEQIREERALVNVPVVLFSSSALHEDVEKCLRAGVKSYVRKPTDYDEYGKVIQSICDYWVGVNLVE